ncbi:hypothetical protein EOD42_10455 [Rhodovarius crocodyli]|uniref:Invasion associated locus B family protein n=1 Tax=Rhodovarius crocodyli TaxID=1979269 RepID=A0A437MGP9_9PROT|nr:hypothetical protein [Rhodovarius crocodyli]RVT96819.1 hypothetical protein EOD42_10455 [Rhodovarius crocodyli]
MQRTSTPIPGTAWVVACVSFPNMPPERRQSCRADLNLSQPGQQVQANLYTLHGGRHWMLRTNLPATGLSIQVEGRPSSHVGRCSGAGLCVLEDAMALTQEMQAGSRVAVTLMTARGGMRSQVATAGINEALRLAAAGTSPAALGDRPTLSVR